jgi:hypothetical protein
MTTAIKTRTTIPPTTPPAIAPTGIGDEPACVGDGGSEPEPVEDGPSEGCEEFDDDDGGATSDYI